MRKNNLALYFFISFTLVFFSFCSNASSLQRDKIIIDDDILSFGSFLEYQFYDLLTKSNFYHGYVAASSGYFDDVKNSQGVIAPTTGCWTRSHDALWKIYDNKIYIVDIKRCEFDFSPNLKNKKNKVFASWVSGEFYVQSKILTKEVKCIGGNGKFLAINQKFHYFKINNGEVVEFKTILRNVEGNSHAYGAFFEECEPLVLR